ncbi:hypothetical protein F5144DRAFT_589409 [Chaetomium tenue]|uniref:Uncharacterized protein n=1 Tax=Chaetomium tenue TaxID=1854479 RepID=A0ACB7PSD2_9PEZI|nr:hypothetical protein F5144DRAFT_589409 [Chaetomium globosum]
MLLPIPEIDDPVERFVAVVKFYLSGWHIRPPGVKKPLNPVLGEVFSCYWDFPDNTRAYYISEQTSHHPPKSSYFYMVPGHNIRVDGTLKPRSKFLGNSAASMMEGTAILSLLNRGADPTKGERYTLTQPNMYARGILFGKMKYELGDHSFVRCPETGLSADIDFKVKGWANTRQTAQREMFFNALKSKPSAPTCRPLEEQAERESQRLWAKTSQAVKERNHELATDEKTKVEEVQREEAAKRANDGVEWHPKLFRPVKGGPGGPEEGEEDLEWIINATIDGTTPEKQAAQIMAIYPIIKGQKFNQQNVIPPRASLEVNEPPKDPPSAAGDLIDFGDSEPTPQPPLAKEQPPAAEEQPQTPANPPPLDPSHPSTTEIQEMLSETGSQAKDGPLVNFHGDMKKNLPGSAKRTDSTASEDNFVDAQG